MNNTIILFDLDGTLIDSTEAIVESFGVAFGLFGERVPREEAITALIGLPLEAMFVRLGVAAESASAHADAYRAHYRTVHTAKTVLLPGAREAIEAAATFAHLGIVTTKTTRYAIELMESFGLMGFFDVLIGQNDVRHPKPHPEPILKALQALPSVTGTVYMVGDTCLDMEAARASKVVGMGVLCGYGSAKSLRQCGDKIFENVSEVVRFVAQT